MRQLVTYSMGGTPTSRRKRSKKAERDIAAASASSSTEISPIGFSENAARFPFFDLDFAHLVTPSLVVCGADDNPRFTSRGPEWHADAYHDGPGARALLTLHGVGHGLGGIAGLDAKETEVEAPDRLEATKRMPLAWLRTILGYDAAAWTSACAAIAGPASALGQIEEKSSRWHWADVSRTSALLA